MSASVDARSSHEDAVLQAEVRHLVRVLAPFRVLHRDALESLSEADRWHECSFERALANAIRWRVIERLPNDFYRLAPEREPQS